jgi:8-oxo-dGTP pyrophosphatase MutT (NUDIX family)
MLSLTNISSMAILIEFNEILESLLAEAFDHGYKAAVGVVEYRNMWLLGLSTATDDRENKWVFPGGHIKNGEKPSKAAEREVYEETGIRCKAVGDGITLSNKKNVVFFHCKADSKQKFNSNNEFVALGWFKVNDMKGLKLYPNVKTLIDKFK